MTLLGTLNSPLSVTLSYSIFNYSHSLVMLFSKTMANHIDIVSHGIRNCNNPDQIFINGTSVENYMRSVEPFRGISGNIEFGNLGNRSNFNLDIVELVSDGLKKIGSWNSRKGIEFIYNRDTIRPDDKNVFYGKNLIVLTVDVSLDFSYKIV